MNNLTNIARQNIKIQGWINFIAGVTFLVPIITLLYKYTGLSDAQIIFISNIFTFGLGILELPTSVIADTCGRKKSLVYSVISNFLCTITIFLFPSYTGFCIASIFTCLYWSFWSGTGQAFLAENLRIVGEENKFGKVIGSFIFYTNLASLLTPIIASVILKTMGNTGYSILAFLDVIFAFILIVQTLKLKEIREVKVEFESFNHFLKVNVQTVINSLKYLLGNSKTQLLIIYTSLSYHLGLLFLMILPILKSNGVSDYYGGIVISIGIIFDMISNKYGHKLSEKYSYSNSLVLASISQAMLLILLGFFYHNWIVVILIYCLFMLVQGLLDPAWNHVLVHNVKGNTIATSRSIVMGILALYMTIGNQIAAFFPLDYFFIILGIFIVIINIFLGNKVRKL